MNKQVKQLVTVLSAAVFGGFILAFILLMQPAPSGRYMGGQVVLSPDVMESINFKDIHPKTLKSVQFIFDHTEFVYFDYLRGSWQQKEISRQAYSRFYQMIASDKSLEDPKNDILELFQKTPPLALATSVRTEIPPAVKIFQIVQFTKEGYYRVKLHSQNNQQEWVYFYHSGLYHSIMNLFIRDVKL